MESDTVLSKVVCADTNMQIIPIATVGDVDSNCIGPPKIEKCPCKDNTFMVEQLLCVRVPVTFHAKASLTPHVEICKNQCPCGCHRQYCQRSFTRCQRRNNFRRFCCCMLAFYFGFW